MALSKRTRKRKTGAKNAVAAIQQVKFWGKRVALVSGVLALFFWAGMWVFLSDSHMRLYLWGANETLDFTADVGFRVENILVEGRENTDRDALLALVNIQKGDPIFLFNPVTAKAQVEKMSWVKHAQVQRRLPNTIYIALTEREPVALYKRGNTLALIDGEGEILTDRDLKRFEDLIMVSGDGAPLYVQELLRMLAAEPALQALVDSAIRIEDRRWNLKLNDGKLVKLPEKDLGLALRSLITAQEEEGLLDKNIKIIDLRDPARIVVRTDLGQAMNIRTSVSAGVPL